MKLFRLRSLVLLLSLTCATAKNAHSEALAPSLCANIPQLEIRGEDSLFTAGDAPNHAFFVLRNRHTVPRTVRLRSLVLLGSSGSVAGLAPAEITNADTGANLGAQLTVAPGQTLRISVSFAQPPRGTTFPIQGSFDQQGCRQQVVSTVRLGTRHPIRP